MRHIITITLSSQSQEIISYLCHKNTSVTQIDMSPALIFGRLYEERIPKTMEFALVSPIRGPGFILAGSQAFTVSESVNVPWIFFRQSCPLQDYDIKRWFKFMTVVCVASHNPPSTYFSNYLIQLKFRKLHTNIPYTRHHQ